jgi:hypothetical protein
MSSLEPWQHGAEMQGQTVNMDREAPLGFRPGVRTLAEMARARGFRTAMLSPNPFLKVHLASGFDFLWTEKQAPPRRWSRRRWDGSGRIPGAGSCCISSSWTCISLLQPPEPYFNYFSVDEGGRRGQEHTDWLLFRRLEQPAPPEFARYRAHKIALL